MVATLGTFGLLVALAFVANPQQDPTPLKPVLVLTAQAPLDAVYEAVRQVFGEMDYEVTTADKGSGRMVAQDLTPLREPDFFMVHVKKLNEKETEIELAVLRRYLIVNGLPGKTLQEFRKLLAVGLNGVTIIEKKPPKRPS